MGKPVAVVTSMANMVNLFDKVPSAPLPLTLEEMAKKMGSVTSFVDFESNVGATLVLPDALLIMGHIERKHGRCFVVLKAQNPTYEGFFVTQRHLEVVASRGFTHCLPRAVTFLSPEMENNRMYVANALLALILDEGGHEAVVEKIRDAQQEAYFEEKLNASQDLLLMFDATKTFEFFIDVIVEGVSYPLCLRTGWERAGLRGEMVKAFVIRLAACPWGTPDEEGSENKYHLGQQVVVSDLFSDDMLNQAEYCLAGDIIDALSTAGLREKAEEAVRDLSGLNGEGQEF